MTGKYIYGLCVYHRKGGNVFIVGERSHGSSRTKRVEKGEALNINGIAGGSRNQNVG